MRDARHHPLAVTTGLRAGFDTAAAALGSVLDVEQLPVADRLTALGTSVLTPRRRERSGWPWRAAGPPGVYLYGPVGRGKTWLVDVLLDQLPPGRHRRLHAYEAARRLHAAIARSSGRPRGVDEAVTSVVDGAALLFLDELHAHDPGDAMLLSRLVRALPTHGAVLVATSNYAPSGLLPDPRHHRLVLPLVAALEASCDVLELAGPVDHRVQGHGGARPGWSSGAWVVPGSAAQLAALDLPVPDPGDRRQLQLGGRPLWAVAAGPDLVHLRFDELCERATSTGDLLELADHSRTLVLDAVPQLSSVGEGARRRFADLVDVCWDRDVRLVVLTAHTRREVLGAAVTDRDRMTSRLSLLRDA